MSKIQTNIAERLKQGRQLAREKHKLGEAAKLGNLRAGNTGGMSEQGDVIGSCPRVLHLRALGMDLDVPEDSKLIMFQMGTANEGVIINDLRHTCAPGEVLLCEEEIPIEWYTKSGVRVTGRPDLVICQLPEGQTELLPIQEGKTLFQSNPGTVPVFGVEIKGIASVWTSRTVLFEGTPKVAHLLQAAHYSWQLGVPFRLMYKQYVNQAVPGWAGKMFPKQGEPNSEHIVYNEKGDIKNINPFEVVYDVSLDSHGYIQYRREDIPGSQWSPTPIHFGDIERYYEHTASIPTTGNLGKRPLAIKADGSKDSYSLCDYCPLSDTCDSSESDYKKWMSAVTKQLQAPATQKKK